MAGIHVLQCRFARVCVSFATGSRAGADVRRTEAVCFTNTW